MPGLPEQACSAIGAVEPALDLDRLLPTEAVRRLIECGVATVPGNSAPDSDPIDLLRRGNLLDDEHEPGSLSRADTNPFDDRCCFEIVPRRGGARQCGAISAAVRMAA